MLVYRLVKALALSGILYIRTSITISSASTHDLYTTETSRSNVVKDYMMSYNYRYHGDSRQVLIGIQLL